MNQNKAETRLANPGVKFPPPLLFVAGLVAAWFLESRVSRFSLIGGDESTAPVETSGLVLIAAGVFLILWAMVMFVRARTAVLPMRPASRIVDTGPYRISRNPMYTGMSLVYLGVMLLLNWGWALVMFPTVLAALYRFVIRREEAYLTAAFGDEYVAYCRRVRRWI